MKREPPVPQPGPENYIEGKYHISPWVVVPFILFACFLIAGLVIKVCA